jgi:hypothetical protein
LERWAQRLPGKRNPLLFYGFQPYPAATAQWAHPPDTVKRFWWSSSSSALEPCWRQVPSTCHDLHASSCSGGTRCGVDGVSWVGQRWRALQLLAWRRWFLEHGHHVFHLFRVLCLKHICYLGDDHGLSFGIREFFFRCLVCNALSDGSGCRPVPLDLFGVFVLNVHTEFGEGLVGRDLGMPFSHGSVKMTTGLVS